MVRLADREHTTKIRGQKQDYENKIRDSKNPADSVVSTQPGDQLTSVASAAAMSAVVAAELAKHGKLDEEDSGGDDQ